MQNDPLVALFAAALEGLMSRGLEVKTIEDGWVIKLANEESSTAASSPSEPTNVRNW